MVRPEQISNGRPVIMNIISVLSAVGHIHIEIKLLVLHNLDSRNIAGSLSYTREPIITQLYMEVIFEAQKRR